MAAVELNPREVKRFINNFILAYELYSDDPEVNAEELLAIQALKVRWNSFYRYFSSSEVFRSLVKDYLFTLNHSEKEQKEFSEWLSASKLNIEYKDFISELNTNDDSRKLVTFFSNWYETLFDIKEWNIYRRVAESTTDIPSSINMTK